MKILSIETNPYVKAFTYHSYPLSILGSNRYCGKKKAEIIIDNSSKYEWKYMHDDVSIENHDNKYIIHGDEYADNIEARIYREANDTDEVIAKINYLQYTQPYGYVSIFFSDQEPHNLEMKEYNEYIKIGVYNKGEVFSGRLTEFVKYGNKLCPNLEYYMKLEIKNDEIKCWLSIDSDNWTLISCYRIEKCKTKKYYIGIHLYLGENQYYNWLYTNYIQLYGRNVFSTEYFVDYFVTPEKDGNFYTIHSLLNYSSIDKSILMESGADIIKFIKANINKGNYIDFILNEFYLEGTSAYESDEYHHANLIYGYDDIGIYILGYGEGQFLKARRIEYNMFLKSLDNGIDNIVIYTFSPLDAYYKLDIETIKKSLTEYWKGINTNLGIEFLLPKSNRETKTTVVCNNGEIFSERLPEFLNVYGLHIYDLFIENDIMIDYMLKDKRISYILYEHKKIMKDRINFLHYKKHISNEYINDILYLTDTLLHEANILLNICLKYRIKQNNNDRNKVKERLIMLKELEENYYPKLLKSLL